MLRDALRFVVEFLSTCQQTEASDGEGDSSGKRIPTPATDNLPWSLGCIGSEYIPAKQAPPTPKVMMPKTYPRRLRSLLVGGFLYFQAIRQC